MVWGRGGDERPEREEEDKCCGEHSLRVDEHDDTGVRVTGPVRGDGVGDGVGDSKVHHDGFAGVRGARRVSTDIGVYVGSMTSRSG